MGDVAGAARRAHRRSVAAQWGLATVAVPKDAVLATARQAAEEV